MLEANKRIWFEKVFSVYNRNLLKRRFHNFKIFGLDNFKNRQNEIPTVVYCNHSSWWDGLVAFQISRESNLDFFVMMEEKQLQNLQLFRKLGAFSVERENPRSAVETINYSVKLLTEKSDRTLWIFPQGKILPNDIRPLVFYNGISRLIEKLGKCQIFSVALRYEFLGEFKPEIYVRVSPGELVEITEKNFDSKNFTKKLAALQVENLEKLKSDILESNFDKFLNII